ncbi:MAG: Rieske 2Fe-2S domain-containing protein [Pseudonocardiaceae bacterium]
MHALQAICPHRGGPLADGQHVICPLHNHAFPAGRRAMHHR